MNNYYIANLKSITCDPKKTWKFLNRELGRNTKCVRDVVKSDGAIVSNDSDKAVEFNNYFINVVNSIHGNLVLNDDDDLNIFRTLVPVRSLQVVSESQIKNVLDS